MTMKFKNVSNKIKFFKINSKIIGVEPNSIIDLPEHSDKSERDLLKIDNTSLETIIEKTNKPNYKSLDELKSMTKDKLNDYAASIGFQELTTSFRKSKMINQIMRFQDENN